MNAIGSRDQCDIQAIIDQDARTIRLGSGDCGAREFAKRFRRQIFFADLNELTTGLSGSGNGFELMMWVGVLLTVSDEIEQR